MYVLYGHGMDVLPPRHLVQTLKPAQGTANSIPTAQLDPSTTSNRRTQQAETRRRPECSVYRRSAHDQHMQCKSQMNPLTATKHIKKKKQGDIKEQCLSGESERETYYYTRLRKKRKERKKKVKIIELRAEFCMHAQCLIARIRDGERGGG